MSVTRLHRAPVPCPHPDRPVFAREACQPCYKAWYWSTPLAEIRRSRALPAPAEEPAEELPPLAFEGWSADARRIVDALEATLAPLTVTLVLAELVRRSSLSTRSA